MRQPAGPQQRFDSNLQRRLSTGIFLASAIRLLEENWLFP